MKFLKIYRTVKDVFVKPKLKWYFGTWKNEPNLPVWRCGPRIHLTKSIGQNKNYKVYYPNNRVNVFEGYSDNKYYGKIKRYGFSYHKLPGKLNPYEPVWNREIRKKLRKWHLSWIPPIIELPIFLSFHFFDNDIMWKTKYDDYRYEYPAHITLVFFGLAISVTAVLPQINGSTTNDDYWEAILNYQEFKDLKKVHETLGWWNSYKDNIKTIRFNPDFLKEPYKSQLIQIQNDTYSSESSIS